MVGDNRLVVDSLAWHGGLSKFNSFELFPNLPFSFQRNLPNRILAQCLAALIAPAVPNFLPGHQAELFRHKDSFACRSVG